MKKTVLGCIAAGLMVVALAVFVANKDILLDDGTESLTAEQADKAQTLTVTQTQPQTQSVPVSDTTAAQTSTTKPLRTNPSFVSESITGAPSASAKTYTGFMPLKTVEFTVADPDNTRGIPTTRIGHSFGAAKDSKPHTISVNSQKFFDEKGFNAITYDAKTSQKVIYLTFDCGYENGYTFNVLDTLKEKNVSAAFFCTLDHIKAEPELIARMIKEGHVVGNHSAKHPDFSTISRTRMAEEIAKCDNYLRENFGYTSPYFRFPEGAYSENALELVGSLGYKSVFWSLAYADWDTSSQKGADYAFEKVTARLHPGAIILLHSVSQDNAQALGDIIDYALSQGYEFRPLTALP